LDLQEAGASNTIRETEEPAMSATTAEPKLVVGPELAGTLMTPEEFDAVEDFDPAYRYELIHGVLVVAPIPQEAEVGPNEWLGHQLLIYHEQHPQGGCLDATLPERYVRTSTGRRRADRVIWVKLGRMPDPRRDTPAIVAEFVSAGRRDRDRDYIDKRHEYEAAGVQEYWVIDRFRREMTVYSTKDLPGGVRVVAEKETYTTALLPGFELPLARLLAIADAWN
jgi:Uma2 family endonuclease